MSNRSAVRQLNRELEAVASAIKHANTSVHKVEDELSALGKRVLAAKRRREEMLHGTHSGQVNNMRSKQGGSRRRRGSKGRKGRKGTKRR